MAIIPPPSNWTDFENMCFHLWKSMWGDHEAHMHGRQGQPQNGVDVYGRPNFQNSYVGVQCKGKNGNYGRKLTTGEIDSECRKAENFNPPLRSFIMATTSPRDAAVQRHCRTLTHNEIHKFSVDTWAWDDIAEELSSRPELMDRFCIAPEHYEMSNNIALSVFSPSQKLHAFFTRPSVFNAIEGKSLPVLENLIYELASNAFCHGNASAFKTAVEGAVITCEDNGRAFDPTSLIGNGKERGGSMTLQYAADMFDFAYERQQTGNKLTITYKGGMPAKGSDEVFTISLEVKDIFGRGRATSYIAEKMSDIPAAAKKIVFDLCGETNPAISQSLEFLTTIKNWLSEDADRSAVLYCPANLYYIETMRKLCQNDHRLKIKTKDGS